MTVKGWEKICHADNKHEKDAIAILILENRPQGKTIDKEGHFIMKKMPAHRKDITIINTYVPNNRTSKYMKQK